MLRIVTAPNPVLSGPAKPVPIKSGTVERIDKSILNLIEKMKKTLLLAKDPEGVGLAAPQIGKPFRIFIAKPMPKSPIGVFINPVIDSISSELTPLKRPKKSKAPNKLEGCLSLPSIWGTVLRSPELTLSYLDEKGNSRKRKFKGFMATIIQHEIDHLNGILFPKRVLEQKARLPSPGGEATGGQGKLYKSHKNKKGEDEFEEIEL